MIARNLARRAEILEGIRVFFRREGFLEVETPIRIPVPLPEAHIDPVGSEGWFLQTSPEVCMKPLVAAGLPRIFQICKAFRRGERGGRHLPELTLLEWYAAGETYREVMERAEALVLFLARRLGAGERLHYGGVEIDLTPPWPRLAVAEAFRRLAGVSAAEALAADRFDEILALEVEPRLEASRPVFLTDYPAACGALARLNPADPATAERCELYIGGIELLNGFSELTDPAEQRRRFERDRELRRRRGQADPGLPERFLEALARLPECAGGALGVDRLTMLFCNAATIDEVVAFPPEAL